MNKLLAFAVGILFVGTSSSWALLGMENVSYDGSLEVRGFSANNEIYKDDNTRKSDRRGEVNTRVRVGINATVTDGVKGRLEFGRTGSTYGRDFGGGQGNSNSIDNETANIRVDNAYVDMADLLGLHVRLGRQYVGNENDLVWNISPREDDNMTINAIDGILLGKNWDMVEASLFMGKAMKLNGQGTTNVDLSTSPADVNLNSLDIVVGKLVPGGKINLGYAWGVRTSESPRNSLGIARLGVNGGAQDNMLTYRAEYLMNTGENKIPAGSKVKYEGNAIDLGVGMNAPENSIGKMSLTLGYLMASGDNNTGNNKDKSFHDFSVLGVASSDRYYGQIYSKSNALTSLNSAYSGPGVDTSGATTSQGQGLNVLNVGFEMAPKMLKNTSVRLDYYNLETNESGNTAASTAKKVGQEWDLTLGYKMNDNVAISGGYAYLKPDKAIVGTGAGVKKDPVTELFANATIKWGSAE